MPNQAGGIFLYSALVLAVLWTPQFAVGSSAGNGGGTGIYEACYGKVPGEPLPAREPRPVLPPAPRGTVRRVLVGDGQKPIALTFDLCESAGRKSGYDSEIVNLLMAERVPATFFAGGKWMRSHPEETRRLIAWPLFEIGNHSMTHANLAGADRKKIEYEIDGAKNEYKSALASLTSLPCAAGAEGTEAALIPAEPGLFRFPYGSCGDEALDLVAGKTLYAIQWDVVPGDPAPGVTAEEITRTILRSAKPGSIVVLHANGKGKETARALERTIPELKKRGFGFFTVSELLSMGTPVVVPECYLSRPGDLERYGRHKK